MALIGLLGAALGHGVNWAICRWRIKPLGYHPWTPRGAADTRRALDFIPLLGWLSLRRESSCWGTAFWLRPLVIELLCGALFAGLYWWEISELGLLPAVLGQALNRMQLFQPGLPQHDEWLVAQATLHTQVFAHAILSLFLVAATFIDWDEMIIPDEITVSGTLLALLGLTFFPTALLPEMLDNPNPLPAWLGKISLGSVTLTAPNSWPQELEGAPQWPSLILGLGCYLIWCAGLLPRVWYGRYGFARAWRYFWATLARQTNWPLLIPLLLLGCGGIAAVWWRGGLAWQGLLTALMGMVGGGLTIWLVRVVAGAVLRREAMGFGDVTLMAMIGAIVGWQATLLIFFLAPLPAMFLGIFQWVVKGQRTLPYGPFLCVATWAAFFVWVFYWELMRPFFYEGWLVPLIMAACLALLAILLGLLMLVKLLIARLLGTHDSTTSE